MNKKALVLIVVFILSCGFLIAPESPFGTGGFSESPFGNSLDNKGTIVQTPAKNPFDTSSTTNTYEKPVVEPAIEKNPFNSSESSSRSVMSGSYNSVSENKNPTGLEKISVKESSEEIAEDKMIDSEVDIFETEDSGNCVLKRVWLEKTAF